LFNSNEKEMKILREGKHRCVKGISTCLRGRTDRSCIMSTIKTFIKNRPVLTYFALAFAISWGGVLVAIGGPNGIPGTPEAFETLLPLVGLAMMAGPPVAGILLTGLIGGRAGFRELLSRLLRWRVGGSWYAVALLTAPLLKMAVLLALLVFSAEFVPGIFVSDNKAFMVLFGLAMALGAGLFEELGWTGFAVSMMRRHYSVLATGPIVGFLWAAWHLLVQVWSPGASAGAFSLSILVLDPFLFMVGYRVLIVQVYDRTQSLLVAILMHVGLTASAVILNPIGFAETAGWPLLTFDLVWAAAVWIVVVWVARANRGQLSQQPLKT
jgi:membrane protease YdiL (CAAX protease family)